MTTQWQVKRFVQPLLERNPDLMHRKNWLYLKPIRHVVGFVKIGSSGSAAYALTDAAVDFSFNNSNVAWGWPIGRPGELLVWDDPAIHPVIIDRIEEALDRMRALTTLQDFEAFASRDRAFYTSPLYGHRDCQLRVDIALGRFDKALVGCRELLEEAAMAPESYFGTMYRSISEPALPLIENGDIAGLIELLRQWQTRYVTTRKLDSIFESTPFPLELQG